MRSLLAPLALLLLAACGGGGGSDTTTQPPGNTSGTLTMVATPTAVSLGGTGTAPIAIVIARGGSFTSTVSLAVSGLPAGVTAAFAPSSIDAGATTSTLTLTANGASAGTSTVTITASGSGVTSATSTVQLTISAGSFTVAASPTALSISAGGSGVTTLNITRTNYTSTVNLSATSPPTGITVAFAPAAVAANTSSITITVAGTVAPGTYTVNVLAQGSGATDRTIPIALTVTAAVPVGFSLAVDPVEFELPAGKGWSGNGIVTIARQNGFTGSVTFTVSTFTGATAAVANTSPQTLTAGNTQTNLLALTLDGAPAGVYSGTVKASAAGFADQVVPVRVRISPPSTGAIRWRFCNASRVPRYFAVRDGNTGTWQHVIPDGPSAATATSPTDFNFTLTQSVAAVAMINLGEKTSASPLIEGHDWKVYYMTKDEITDLANSECTRFPDVNNRTATLPVTGYGSFDLVLGGVSANNFQYSASTSQATTTFGLTNLQPGPFDVMMSKSSSSLPTATMTAFSLQRALNPGSGATMSTINLAAATAPTVSSYTVGNTNGETFFSIQTFMTAAGLNAIMSTSGAFSNTTRSWWGVPVGQTIAGDLHQLIVTTATGAPRRSVISYARTPSSRTIDFGPALTAPTVTAGANGTPAWIVRATGTLSADYTSRASLHLREQFVDPRTMTIYATRGYLGAGNAYDIAVPDLSAATGFTFFWNFHRNTTVAYTFTGGDGDPGGTMESNCILAGICFVKAVDGAIYKSAQSIGTVGVP